MGMTKITWTARLNVTESRQFAIGFFAARSNHRTGFDVCYTLATWPLFNDDVKVIKLFDCSLDVEPNSGAIF